MFHVKQFKKRVFVYNDILNYKICFKPVFVYRYIFYMRIDIRYNNTMHSNNIFDCIVCDTMI